MLALHLTIGASDRLTALPRIQESEDTMVEDLSWFVSSYCANQGHCVQIAHTGTGPFIRDSEHNEGPLLHIRASEWAAFLAPTQP